MDIEPHILIGKVAHKRHFSKINQFAYHIYYLVLPLARLKDDAFKARLAMNKPSWMSFYEKDHGGRDGRPLYRWIDDILAQYGFGSKIKHITLIAMPRIFGYVFNPISFWMCLDKDKKLRAVLCEVNNTFGETHHYLCAHPHHRAIENNHWLRAEKIFHVSPFMTRQGHYRFRFSWGGDNIGIWIHYYDKANRKLLTTSLCGGLKPLTRANLRQVFWTYKLITLKTIFLIHWQAVKLWSKHITFVPKPPPHQPNISASNGLKERDR